IGPEVPQGSVGDDRGEFGGGADRDRDGIAELALEQLGHGAFQFGGGADGRAEKHVSAGDEGGNVGGGELGDDGLEMIHFDAATAEVDAAEEGDVAGHGGRGLNSGRVDVGGGIPAGERSGADVVQAKFMKDSDGAGVVRAGQSQNGGESEGMTAVIEERPAGLGGMAAAGMLRQQAVADVRILEAVAANEASGAD